jgi:hypothetical protein
MAALPNNTEDTPFQYMGMSGTGLQQDIDSQEVLVCSLHLHSSSLLLTGFCLKNQFFSWLKFLIHKFVAYSFLKVFSGPFWLDQT